MNETLIRRLVANEWELLRDLRLAALKESPDAFGSVLESELTFDEAKWRSWLETSAYFVAEAGGSTIGMACAVRISEPGGDFRPTMELVSMWVAPQHRRQGVGAALVARVLDYAREEGEPLVGLWVAAGNEPAEALYSTAGFVRTGEEQTMPSRPTESEVRMTVSP